MISSEKFKAIQRKVNLNIYFTSKPVKCVEDKEGMHKRATLKPCDPMLISSTLATAPPPSTSQLVSEKNQD